ncbi:helix-turn-helix DNA binding domain protein [Mycobacterium phage Thonko]|uniref:Helix-turn-helix DNA binding domain protein n=1 Tax=Mycobacterium phage Thonko TaxID=2282910 RepID=A0A346FC91_9CAUD|nr:HTH DNA binding protein [Mycobacterium phage Thonko]AXN53316.1 helix-turn-helix DNA binding domain protein [Mycobacterium phage Thonko]
MKPATYADGYGELIAAHRAYLGLSQRGMAKRLGMDRRSYQRVENSVDQCPPGLIDSIEKVVAEFDDKVDHLIETIETWPGGDGPTITVDTDPRREWERSIARRAVVIANAPASLTLVGEQPNERSA